MTAQGTALRTAYSRIQPGLFVVAIVLFLLSSAVHYLVVVVDQSRTAETRALRLQMLAAHAELRALHAQITPHFLFNSLNSISALTSTDPAGARHMCVLLGDFLRGTLQIGQPRTDSAAAGAGAGRSVPRHRTGPVRRPAAHRARHPERHARLPRAAAHRAAARRERAAARRRTDARRRDRPDGGVAQRRCPRVHDRQSRSIAALVRNEGSGLGLENVRRRIEAVYGTRASISAGARQDRYSVAITLPAVTAKEHT